MPKPSKKETAFILAERDRLKVVGDKLGVRLVGFDHLGSSAYGPPHATYEHPTDQSLARVTLPYWFIERMSETRT
jgi:hypothetical protein